MLEETLVNYGMAGIFISYLIYHQQTTLKELIETIKTNTLVTQSLKDSIEKKE